MSYEAKTKRERERERGGGGRVTERKAEQQIETQRDGDRKSKRFLGKNTPGLSFEAMTY